MTHIPNFMKHSSRCIMESTPFCGSVCRFPKGKETSSFGWKASRRKCWSTGCGPFWMCPFLESEVGIDWIDGRFNLKELVVRVSQPPFNIKEWICFGLFWTPFLDFKQLSRGFLTTLFQCFAKAKRTVDVRSIYYKGMGAQEVLCQSSQKQQWVKQTLHVDRKHLEWQDNLSRPDPGSLQSIKW